MAVCCCMLQDEQAMDSELCCAIAALIRLHELCFAVAVLLGAFAPRKSPETFLERHFN